MCENKDKKLNISCFAACFEQKGKHLNLWASAFKPPGKSFLHVGQSLRRNRRNIATGKSEQLVNSFAESKSKTNHQLKKTIYNHEKATFIHACVGLPADSLLLRTDSGREDRRRATNHGRNRRLFRNSRRPDRIGQSGRIPARRYLYI